LYFDSTGGRLYAGSEWREHLRLLESGAFGTRTRSIRPCWLEHHLVLVQPEKCRQPTSSFRDISEVRLDAKQQRRAAVLCA